ncbi:MAG: ArsC family reductase [Gammaproteobacteria bacterium]|nr:ArsC family reductase [Gammaproteobacteria bacterium]MDH5594110.1 ArsC family reductase [Gammaproteobacteria bacterium]
MIKIYGIKNCDTIKKARKWLDTKNIPYQFHDVRNDGLEKSDLSKWVKQIGWETLLNRRGTTWRQLAEKDKTNIDESKAINLMHTHPAMIKRPVLVKGKSVHVGFSEKEYKDLLQ